MPQFDWQARLERTLPVFGHRNWIVIADSAYPSQSSNAIQTVLCHSPHIEVVRQVLLELARSGHVEPRPFVDQELRFLPESDAPGISVYRRQLAELLPAPLELPHEKLLSKLHQVSQEFRVLILKTNMTLPYTSIFLELDCAYWNQAAEHRLQSVITEHHELSNDD